MLKDTISIELFYNTDYWKAHGEIFLHDGFFMLRSFNIAGREFLMPTQPYLLQEGRVVLVKQGYANYTFDLVDYHFQAGDLVVFYNETLIEKRDHSDDFQFDAFSFKSRRSDRSFTLLHLTPQTAPVVNGHFALLWSLVHQQPMPADSVRSLTDSLLQYVALHENDDTGRQADAPRPGDTLRRFLSLVSRHAAHERNIPFYARQLCLAPHYLSTLISRQSGRTPMQWINHTAVKEIKVWLAYSDETAAQIADRMAFPCPSALTRFFKRETGMTPSQYRKRPRSAPPVLSKTDIRRHIRELKTTTPQATLNAASDRIAHAILCHPRWQTAHTLLLYHALHDEVSTMALLAEALHQGKHVLLPAVVGDNLQLKTYQGPATLQPGPFGILEPTGPTFSPEEYSLIDLAIIPGMAFDSQNHRLGRGKGFYDRLLPQLPNAYRIGICWSFQHIDILPTEPHDRPVDEVISY